MANETSHGKTKKATVKQKLLRQNEKDTAKWKIRQQNKKARANTVFGILSKNIS